jgi:hypothetical protein
MNRSTFIAASCWFSSLERWFSSKIRGGFKRAAIRRRKNELAVRLLQQEPVPDPPP